MDTCKIPPEEAIGRCSQCGKSIPGNSPVFGISGKKRLGADVSAYEGGAVRIKLVTEDREVVALVATANSEARKVGYDFMFITCSETCAYEIRTTLEREAALGDVLFDKLGSMQN